MDIHLIIPDSVAQALRLPPAERQEQLLTELALALYERGFLSFGKARELAGVSWLKFSLLLGERDIPRHYTDEDMQEDLAYGRGE